MARFRGWLGAFIVYFFLQGVLLALGTLFDQSIIVYSAAILLGGFGVIMGCALWQANRIVRDVRRTGVLEEAPR